jgi:hypothetical protein
MRCAPKMKPTAGHAAVKVSDKVTTSVPSAQFRGSHGASGRGFHLGSKAAHVRTQVNGKR